MRTKQNQSDGDRFAFTEDADEELWATRDYFWALEEGLLDGHSPAIWSSFRDGYARQSHPPARRVA